MIEKGEGKVKAFEQVHQRKDQDADAHEPLPLRLTGVEFRKDPVEEEHLYRRKNVVEPLIADLPVEPHQPAGRFDEDGKEHIHLKIAPEARVLPKQKKGEKQANDFYQQVDGIH